MIYLYTGFSWIGWEAEATVAVRHHQGVMREEDVVRALEVAMVGVVEISQPAY